MRTLRSLALASCLALGVAACGPGASDDATPDVPVVTPAPLDTRTDGGATAAPSPTPTGAGTPSEGGVAQPPGNDGPAPTEPAPSAPPAPGLTPVDDDGLVGANARAYLRGDRPTLVLEVDVQSGVSLSNAVLSHVSGILDRESNAAVTVRQGSATATKRDVWTIEQLRATAAETRDAASSPDAAVMHLLVLDGEYEQDGVLGLAFDASSAVVFPDTWASLSTLLLSDAAIARAVTTHEVGHLLGLVGLVQPPTSAHEDPDNPGHTSREDDVMYWAIETTFIINLAGGPPDDFSEVTRADLAALRDG